MSPAATSSGSYERIELDREGGTAWITLARPDQLNALDPEMLDELLGALDGLSRTRDVNTVVVSGQGRAFCAGVDLRTPFFMENVDDASVFAGKRLLDKQHELISALWEMPQLTMAAIQGDAVGGGGFGMAMACDLRYAVRGARFWMVPGALNVVQDFGLTWSLQREIGMSRTLEMVMTGRVVTAEEGASWGFVLECLDDMEALNAHVRGVTNAVARIAPDAAKTLKYVVRHGRNSALRDQLHLEAIANGLTFQSEEFHEAKNLFMRRTGKDV